MRFLAMEVGLRTTVIRLADGSLFIDSPGRLVDDLKRELETIGPVRLIIAPDRFHHLFVSDYQTVYLQAEFIARPALRRSARISGSTGS